MELLVKYEWTTVKKGSGRSELGGRTGGGEITVSVPDTLTNIEEIYPELKMVIAADIPNHHKFDKSEKFTSLSIISATQKPNK